MGRARVRAAARRGPRCSARDRVGEAAWLTVCLLLVSAVVVASLTGCGRAKKESTSLGERVIPLGQPVPKGGGVYKVGNPYEINGRTYHPREDASYDRVGIASWYGELFHGRRTANGEIYDMMALTAAHPTLPMPTYARVTNLANGRSLVVRVNDRGPFAHDRIIDLSQRTADLLGFKQRGTAPVRVTYLGPAPLGGDDSYERRVLASQSWLRHASAETRKLATEGDSSPMDRRDAPRGAVAVASAPRADPMVVGSLPGAGAGRRPADASPERPVFVQAGSFRGKANAERLRQALDGIGPIDVLPTVVEGVEYHRVRLGPFAHPEAVRDAIARAEAAGAVGARATHE